MVLFILKTAFVTVYSRIYHLVSVGLLHGDMTQMERNDVITTFKKKEIPILVATDVAGTVHRVNFAPFFFYWPFYTCKLFWLHLEFTQSQLHDRYTLNSYIIVI